jgi:hypothetical protein
MRCLLILIFVAISIGAAEPKLTGVVLQEGQWRLGVPNAQFRAVTSELWPPGLVPIFVVEKKGALHLRRFPLKGQENISEPLFFGEPLEDEKPFLGGRWEITATRALERPFLYWELVMDGPKITGRFDRYTDYRFGTMSGGEFVSNRFEMKIEYVADAYLLSGKFVDGKLKGIWKRADEAEHGTWEAKQNAVELPAMTNLVRLYEWRKGEERGYAVEGKAVGEGWLRAERALCRVWGMNRDTSRF